MDVYVAVFRVWGMHFWYLCALFAMKDWYIHNICSFLFLGYDYFNIVMDITKWFFGVITRRFVSGCVYISVFMIGGKYFLVFMCIFAMKSWYYITSDFSTHFGIINTYHIFFRHDQVCFVWFKVFSTMEVSCLWFFSSRNIYFHDKCNYI